MEDIKAVIERLSMKAITSKVEAKDYPNCIVLKKDLITLLDRLEQLEKENTQLKEIEKEHQKLNGELRKENKELKADNYSANCIISDQIDLLRDSIPKSKIIEKIEELGEKKKATKDMCKSLALSTARTTLAEIIGLDNMVNLFQGCDTLIELNESGGSNE